MFFFLKGQLMYDLPHDHHHPSPVASKGTQIWASLGGGKGRNECGLITYIQGHSP